MQMKHSLRDVAVAELQSLTCSIRDLEESKCSTLRVSGWNNSGVHQVATSHNVLQGHCDRSGHVATSHNTLQEAATGHDML